MPLYSCLKCEFTTHLKSNYTRHLNTKKHKMWSKSSYASGAKGINDPEKPLLSSTQIHTKPHKNPDFPHKSTFCVEISENYGGKKEYSKNQNQKESLYECKSCGKQFKRADSLKRHLSQYCKKSDDIYKKLYLEQKKELEDQKQNLIEERKEFKKHIELLLTKVGNTNITNNIQLNSYGKEDMTHISDNMKTQLLASPYKMIPKMIEFVHFNDSKPENKNIILSNMRDNKVKIFSAGKWVYKDKEETLTDLIDGKYFILDNHYNMVSQKIPDYAKESYEKFRDYFDANEKALLSSIKKDCEMTLINNR